jgi:hypothetical protein
MNSKEGSVQPCEPPALERCVGFNETSQTTICGKFFWFVGCWLLLLLLLVVVGSW